MYNNTTLHEKCIKLFNGVVGKDEGDLPLTNFDHGIVLDANSVWAEGIIINTLDKLKLSGESLNKTFHKSWKKIQESDRFELLVDQLMHYVSGYGSNFENELYIPKETLDFPEDLRFKVITAYSAQDLVNKCLSLLKSGIALKQETVEDVLFILESLGYTFTSLEGIKNKEAMVQVCDKHSIYPSDPTEFLRFVVYKTTGETLLIKDRNLISSIKSSNFNPVLLFENYGLEELSSIFNRYKVLFLAYKNKCPSTINKLSKLSKTNHKPSSKNSLNLVTSEVLTNDDLQAMNKATPFVLFRALNSCITRFRGQNSFVYRIRNGKSWVKETPVNKDVCASNIKFILDYLLERYDFSGKVIYIPEEIEYALPISEKNFVGNIPTGTKVHGNKLAAGVYWENSWGADDIDVAAININGKVGWNSSYNMGDSLMYSGDIINAPNGAVEYLWASLGSNIQPSLITSNVYSGDSECGYKIVVGKGDDISREYMMNPNNVIIDEKCNSVQNQTVLGLVKPDKKGMSFTLLNFGSGNARVSGYSEPTSIAIKALYQQWEHSMTLNELLEGLGATITNNPEDEYDVNLSVDSLDKTSIINLFEINTTSKGSSY